MERHFFKNILITLILCQLYANTISKVVNEDNVDNVTDDGTVLELTTVPAPQVKPEEEIKFRLFGDVKTPARLPIGNSLLTTFNTEQENKSENKTNLDGIEPWALFPASKLRCACGKTHEFKIPDDEKIVGGQEAYIRDYPWTVALVRRQTVGFGGQSFPFCGGTLINARYVLTASHCVDGQEARGIQILINEQDLLTSTEAKTMRVDIDQIIMHEGYNRHNIDNDIALIRLLHPVDISSHDVITRPVCLTTSSFDFSGHSAVVAATSEGSSTSNTLRKVDVPVISNRDCNEKSTYNGKITENMLCAGNINEGGQDSCQGDSGGPLIAVYGGRKTLIGVVSWGHGCARPKSPGVYTRVTRYSQWILSKVGDDYWCDG